MPYIGQRPSKGDENNFKILDDISSYTLTFDGSDSSVVSAANDTITSLNHRFVQGQRVTYTDGDGSAIAGLTDATVYFIIKEDHNTIKLATSASNASNGVAVNITNVGSGSSHTLNVAFDGVNTKFKATHTTGQKARITRSAQLVISMNGVIQQPHDTATPSTGFGFDLDGTIVFSQAPVSSDIFWAHVLTNNNVTFDISDNDIDNFTGDGSTVSFNLTKSPPDNRNVLVTVDGVVQYPNDPDGTERSYTVVENVLTFSVAPALGTEVQVRHIGFAGSSSGSGSGGVTSVYGRTGAVVLKSTDNITVNDAAITGNATVTGDLTVNGTTTTLDTQLVEVDKIEVETESINVAVAVTHNGSGDLIRLYDGTTQKVTIDDEGKVGLGSAIPSQKLDVDGTVKATTFVGALTGTASGNTVIANNADNRVITGGSGVNLNGEANLTFNGSTLTVSGKVACDVNSDIDMSNSADGQLVIGGNGYTSAIALNDEAMQIYHNSSSRGIIFGINEQEKVRIDSDGDVIIGSGGSWQYKKPLNVQGSSGSIISLYNGDTTSYAADTYSAIELKILTGNTGNTFGALEIRGIKEEGTNGNNARALTFYTGANGGSNQERLRIDSDGKIGIGLTNPEWKLAVYDADYTGVTIKSNRNTATDNIGGLHFKTRTTNVAYIQSLVDGTIKFRNSSSLDERLRLKSDGKLFLHGTGATGANNTTTRLPNGYTFNIHGNSSEDGISIVRYNSGYGAYGLNIGRSRSNTVGTNLAVVDGNELGHITFYGANGSSFSYAAQITAIVDGEVGTGGDTTDMPGALSFRTTSDGSGGTTPTERLRINSVGDLLLGNHGSRIFDDSSGTNVVVDIYGGTTAGKRGILALGGRTGSDNADIGTIQFVNENNNLATSSNHVQSKLVASIDVKSETTTSNSGANSGGHLLFSTKGENAALAEAVRITGDGDVGINEDDPQKFLHVTGNTTKGAAHFGMFGTNGGNAYIGNTPVVTISTDGNANAGTNDDKAIFQVGRGGGGAGAAAVTKDLFRVNLGGSVQIGGATENSADIDAANSKLTIKQSANSQEDGIYIERSGERRGFYIYVGGALSQNDALGIVSQQLGGDTAVLSIDRGGDVVVGAGNIVMANDKGIDFSAETNEGSTSQNTLLADYEEGVWTPTNTIGMTLTVNNGAHYIKIGKQVTVWFDVSLTGNPDSAQCASIENLPYVSKSSNTYYGQSNTVWYSNTGDAKRDYDDDNTLIFVNNNSTTIRIWNVTSGHDRVRSWANGRRFRGTVTYIAKN